MIENRPWLTIFSHTMLILGIAVILFPLYVAFVAATLDKQEVYAAPMTLIPGTHLLENIHNIWVNGVGTNSAPFWRMLLNSFVMAFSITLGKITVSMLSAFAIVWFRFPLRNLFFWMIFITLMLPVEVRIFPTVEVIANLKMLDSYAGLTLPLMASATATFLFRQFFMTLPDELVEAAKIDGAGEYRIFGQIIFPLSKPVLATIALFACLAYWNDWWLGIMLVDKVEMQPLQLLLRTITSNIQFLSTAGNANAVAVASSSIPSEAIKMATCIITIGPIILVYPFVQKYFVKGIMVGAVKG